MLIWNIIVVGMVIIETELRVACIQTLIVLPSNAVVVEDVVEGDLKI